MSKILRDLEKGDKLYFFYSDEIIEHVVEDTDYSKKKFYRGSINDPEYEWVFEIQFKDCPTLALHNGQWLSDSAFTNVCTDEGYALGIYATSIETIGEVLENRYKKAVEDKESAIKSADEAIMRARKQKEMFNKVRIAKK